MITNQPLIVVVSYSFDNIFSAVRNRVAIENRKSELKSTPQAQRIVWHDDVEHKLLLGAWTRINEYLCGRLSGWLTAANVTAEHAELTFSLKGNSTVTASAIESKLRQILIAAFMRELTASAANACESYGDACIQTPVNELVSTLALDSIYNL